MRKKKSGQFSLEFVLTYGWVILIFLGAIGVMYSTGMLNFSELLPEECKFLGQITCDDFQVLSTGNINILVTNDLGTNLIIYNATVNDGSDLTCGGLSQQVNWESSQQVEVNITGCSGTAYQIGNRINGNILLTFYRNSTCVNGADSDCRYTSLGRLVSAVY